MSGLDLEGILGLTSSGLDRWLKQATRRLSDDSAAQVRAEIQEHYESTREAAINAGATADEADQLALTALGDANTANCQYQKVLLTAAEARVLQEGEKDWESKIIRFDRRIRFRPLLGPVIALCAAMVLFCTDAVHLARVLLYLGIMLVFSGFMSRFIVPRLPIYTPARSRIVRCVKWVVLAGAPLLALPSLSAFTFFGLLTAILLPPACWVEWKRISIRRKLPVAQWPKHLYL